MTLPRITAADAAQFPMVCSATGPVRRYSDWRIQRGLRAPGTLLRIKLQRTAPRPGGKIK